MLDKEKYTVFNNVLMKMGRVARSQTWFNRHSIPQETIDEMLVFDYLIEYEKDDEIYYKPTLKSQEIW